MELVNGQPLLLTTGRYKDFDPKYGVAIRITVGRPRFVRYPYEEALSLAPHELFKPPYKDIDDIPTERWVYNKRLAEHEAAILEELRSVARKHPGRGGVLLCYENVNAGEACHRRWAAEWFKQRYGWNIPEIGTGDLQLLAF
ncbi:hypothetical protein [Streptosporangium sp. NPDC000563]|uniref:hypothetical protein n=1 Tax=unclassified Streptosporangium TaxID=2632669 RepID=UPI0033222952